MLKVSRHLERADFLDFVRYGVFAHGRGLRGSGSHIRLFFVPEQVTK